MKSPFQRIISINLVVLLGLTILAYLSSKGSEKDSAFEITLGFGIILIQFLNLVGAASSARAESRRGFWLSFWLMFLIGFGTCAGVGIVLS